MALLLPVTYTLSVETALMASASIYMAGMCGGSITAVTINIPGAPSSMMTALDGYPMQQKGKGALALGHAALGSMFGGALGALLLIAVAPFVAEVSLLVMTTGKFSLLAFAIVVVVIAQRGRIHQAGLAACIGLMLATIGLDAMEPITRFTYGYSNLTAGIDLMPVIIGTLPGIPDSLPDTESKKGFQDITGNYPKYKDETDVNRLAVGDDDNPHSTLTIRKADRTTNMGRADFEEVQAFMGNIVVPEGITLPADDGTSFNEPTIPYDATYPYNHVYESEGGHIREMDDTPGKERIHERHSSGTGYEVHPDGTRVARVKGDNYDLTTGDAYVHIKGNHSTTVDGGVRIFVNADASTDDQNYTIQVGKNANVNIQVDGGNVNVVTKSDGDINLMSDRNINMQTKGFRLQANTVDIDVANNWNETSGNKTESTGTHQMNSTTTTIVGPENINLNP